MAIADNVREVLDRIEAATSNVLRDPSDVTLVAVTKTVGRAAIVEAIEAGVTCIGENRVQEAERKFAEGLPPVEKHLVGHLQTNKVRTALPLFDMIQSVDSVRLAREISTQCRAAGCEASVLSRSTPPARSPSSGSSPTRRSRPSRRWPTCRGSASVGLMTVGAFLPDPEDVRPCFRRLRELRNAIEESVIPGVSMEHLSMGMTNDFEVAIEEGATIVRVGRAVFGERG